MKTKIPMWSIYVCIFLTIYSLAGSLKEMKGIFSNLIFMWVKKFIDKF